jgi:hypothetical protein
MREVADIENGRFSMVGNRWEQWFVDCARIMVDMSRDLYLENPDLSIEYTEKKLVKQIKWKDVDLEDNPFDIQTFPVSQLPDTPAGRIQTISEYIQNGWISKEKGMQLLNLDPDLEGEIDIQTASLRLTEKWISEMVEEGIYHSPDPHMNLQLAQSTAQGAYVQLVVDGCPDEKLEMVRDFIQECIEMLTPPAPPQQMPPESNGMPGQTNPTDASMQQTQPVQMQ